MNGRRLFRSTSERVFGGVAGGVAEYFDLDPALVRVAWAILILASGGVFLLLYIVMWFVVPEAPPGMISGQPWAPGGAPLTGANAGAGPAGVATGAAQAASGEPGATAPGQPTSIAHDWAAQRAARREHRSGGGAIVFGALLVLVGAWLLVRNYVTWLNVDQVWPVAIILLGLLLLVTAMRPRP